MAVKRRFSQTHEQTPILPLDIIESVLAHLPVKSLLRFRAVSKLWNHIVSTPYLIKIQSQTASSCLPIHFLLWGKPEVKDSTASEGFCLLKFSGKRFKLDADLGAPFGRAKILHSCNGIVLLHRLPGRNLFLWNPCTRMYTTVSPHFRSVMANGICYDTNTDDYKVVIITGQKMYWVFSCKQKIWTKKREKCPDFYLIRNTGASVNGSFYWVGFQQDGMRIFHPILMCFNGIDDKCRTIELPVPASIIRMVPVNLGGCVGLIYVDHQPSVRIQIMKMEGNCDGNSWRQLMAIDIEYNMCEFFLNIRPPCSMTDNLVMIFVGDSRCVVYDVCEERAIGGLRDFPRGCIGMVVPCQDRLFFPIQRNIRPRRSCRTDTY